MISTNKYKEIHRSSHRYTPKILAISINFVAMGLLAPQLAAQETSAGVLEEVLVNARRLSENLQDVPVSAQVVSGDMIDGMVMTSPTELAKFTPGLNLSLEDPGVPVIALRGVRWTQASGTSAIPIYLNEISFDPLQVLQTMYDIGQVEVLRGPQGTARGASSISGALTFTTRRPDLQEVGGYVSGLWGEAGHRNLQGAINIPIIKDKLAVRIAANYEESEANRIASANSSRDPSLDVKSARVSVRYEPVDTVAIDFMWQRLDQESHTFSQLVGSGSPGIPDLNIPANFNGPALNLGDRRGAGELSTTRLYETDLITLNASWDIPGHTLNYNFGAQFSTNPPHGVALDPTNLLVGFDIRELIVNDDDEYKFYVHELRLSSERDGERAFDYDVGLYYHETDGVLQFNTIGAFLPSGVAGELPSAAFGNPYSPPPSPFANRAAADRYALRTSTDIQLATENFSVYGSVVWHWSEATELAVGLRWIDETKPARIETNFNAAVLAITPNLGLACTDLSDQLEQSPIYSDVCDVDASLLLPELPVEIYEQSENETIYNISLSHRFGDDLMAYATVGTSWRTGLPAISNTGLPADLLFPEPEEATSYEIGVKSNWGGWLRANAALYQIDYGNQLSQFQAVPYHNNVTGETAETSLAFFSNVDGKVQGAELELAAQLIENLTLNLNLNYATLESEGSTVPCNDPSRPVNAANPINFCPAEKGDSLNASPEFQASFFGDYSLPLGSFDGYARLLVNYQGKNDNFGASNRSANAYTTVDVTMGLISDSQGWDIGLYGKNVFDEEVELTRNDILAGAGLDAQFGPSGYSVVTTNAPREFGISLRYAFGVR